jgi:hypothetical protein
MKNEDSASKTHTPRHRSARQKSVDRKIQAARSKRELGEELTEYEWMIVQYALGGACSSCRGRRR